MADVGRVGGKNASLGEMISSLSDLGVSVPTGFATTADAFRHFLDSNDLVAKINGKLDALDVEDVDALTATGAEIRKMISDAPFPDDLRTAIADHWKAVSGGEDVSFAIRSSATAEDLPDASFAGQQETLLNVCGLENVVAAIHEVYRSLYNDRAIAYRVHHSFSHSDVALSVGVQRMVRSDLGCSGVMFTIDTESGFDEVVFITSSYGLGEAVVQGAVNPDEFYVYKPALRAGRPALLRRNIGSKLTQLVYSSDAAKRVEWADVDPENSRRFSLTDAEVTRLAELALIIEKHYGRPMDIEWGKDGEDGELYILQARPETVKSREVRTQVRFTLKESGPVIVTGRSIGQRVGAGTARVIDDVASMNQLEPGDVLVTDMTDPDWEPVMKRAAAIVTNRGGRTCHAAIIARELGIPAVVGCGDATERVKDGRAVTVSCAEGDEGYVYAGKLTYEETETELDALPELPVKIMMNVGNPDRAFAFASLPHRGVGLARLEFIINRMIGVHPKAILEYKDQERSIRAQIDSQMQGFEDPREFFLTRLTEGVATIAAAFAPQPVIVRMSDFKSNEYANLIGGQRYEPTEENPMLGFRGASRYLDDGFADCFALECEAMRRVREDMGLENVELMIPFVRTVNEAERVIGRLADNGLERGKCGLRLIMMCELPSNALLADRFLEHFDGMSIGSNDMTQLTLGLDRDSGKIADLFDERDPAVLQLLALAIKACKAKGKYIGICGQGPSDHPDLARWLLDQGIESISLNPDSVIDTWLFIADPKNSIASQATT
jgi:pyruvate,water dikinase